MEWDLQGLHSGRTDLIALLDEQKLWATGGPISPQLHFPLEWQEWDQGTRWDARDRVLAVSLELHPSGNSNMPLVQTGLIPQSGYGQRLLCLPLSQALIEDLSRRAESTPDGVVWLHISMSVMGQPATRSGGTATSARSPGTGEIVIYGATGVRSVCVSALQWSKFLETWGYPGVRFVAVPMQLPDVLHGGNMDAGTLWDGVIQALIKAQNTWRSKVPSEAGLELRRALLLAGQTWDALWHPQEPTRPTDLKEILTRLGAHIPGWQEKPFYIPEKAAPDTKRVLSWLLLLRDLNLLVNPLLHSGLKPVYLPSDVEALVTSITAMLRALPPFWEDFPSPDAMKDSVTT